jgi:hypothetical protein
LQSYHINGGNGNGGASVSVNYSAWYDVLLYENAMVIILHEGYWIPPVVDPKRWTDFKRHLGGS